MSTVLKRQADIDVVTAAKMRLVNIFNNGTKVYINFSGGKDSMCLGQLVVELIQGGKINPAQIEVVFIDEEGMYEDIIENVKWWRKKFLLLGCKFTWFCLQVKHFNCLHALVDDESWICWDETCPDKWIRRPPAFAVFKHPMLKERRETYQSFLSKYMIDGASVDGVRMSESFQRVKYMSTSMGSMMAKHGKVTVAKNNRISPLYDWKDSDVWLFIKDRGLPLPVAYMYLYQVGVNRNRLRVSQFFAIDTVGSLVNLSQFYPDLMDRICEREENAYIALLYWDSEMFHRRTAARKAIEDNEPPKDYKALLEETFRNPGRYFTNPHAMQICQAYKRAYIGLQSMMTEKHYRRMYEALKSGDTKRRSLRGVCATIRCDYIKKAQEEERARKEQQNG